MSEAAQGTAKSEPDAPHILFLLRLDHCQFRVKSTHCKWERSHVTEGGGGAGSPHTHTHTLRRTVNIEREREVWYPSHTDVCIFALWELHTDSTFPDLWPSILILTGGNLPPVTSPMAASSVHLHRFILTSSLSLGIEPRTLSLQGNHANHQTTVCGSEHVPLWPVATTVLNEEKQRPLWLWQNHTLLLWTSHQFSQNMILLKNVESSDLWEKKKNQSLLNAGLLATLLICPELLRNAAT